MSNYRMESHKLIYHPQAVADWLSGSNIYPIELEIGLSGACNHRCVFCAVDYLEYKPVRLDKNILLDNLSVISKKGLKSINYSGEGEPLMHPDAEEVFCKTKSLGIDIGMSTNCVLFAPERIRECLSSFSWVRVSMAGIKDQTYESIHKCRSGDLQKALANLQYAVEYKKANKLSVTIGVQLLLLPENKEEVVEMAIELKRIGVDYFSVKPYSQHPLSKNRTEIDYNDLLKLETELAEIKTADFNVIFRANSMKKMKSDKQYKQCLGLSFMAYIDARGDLYPCIAFLGRNDFTYGNLYSDSFTEIWEGNNRLRVVEMLNAMDINKECREGCRLDEINKYLNELKHPSSHVNFI